MLQFESTTRATVSHPKFVTASPRITDPHLARHLTTIRDFLSSSTVDAATCVLNGVEQFSQIVELDESLRAEGIKLKWQWSEKDLRATVAMPVSCLHNVGGNWLAKNMKDLQGMVTTYSPCGSRRLLLSADALCAPVGMPDQGIYVRNDRLAPGENDPTCPRLIWETALSQPYHDVLAKAQRWLWETNCDVHVVVIYKIAYPAKSSGFLEVWVRDGDEDTIQPLDSCTDSSNATLGLEDQPPATVTNYGSPEDPIPSLKNANPSSVDLAQDSMASPRSSTETCVDLPRVGVPQDKVPRVEENAPSDDQYGPTDQRIQRRGPRIIVFDQQAPRPVPDTAPLELYLLDFIRPCGIAETSNWAVHLKLRDLQEDTLAAIEQEKKVVNKVPLGPSLKLAGQKRKIVSGGIYLDPTELSKRARQAGSGSDHS
ncbi:hypothetical protein BDV93DRAFT_511367 [Ceratobasidium sp. AG-I]|nr:hypothetical protein BDV93DRAFT_511367 [Ceratobasidium sp. AG-I]